MDWKGRGAEASGVECWIGHVQRARAVRRSRCRSSSRSSRTWRPATPSSTTRTTTSITRRTWCTPPTTCSSRRSSWYALLLLTPSYSRLSHIDPRQVLLHVTHSVDDARSTGWAISSCSRVCSPRSSTTSSTPAPTTASISIPGGDWVLCSKIEFIWRDYHRK